MPSKNTICALCLSLNLNIEEARGLLDKAGYTLSESIRFDKAISYFIENRMYNVIEDNIILYDNGIEQLGTQSK